MSLEFVDTDFEKVTYLVNLLTARAWSPMEKGWIVFAISFLEPRGNSEQNGYVQILFYINSICVFSKAI